jgi:glycosyltransferase involved in cell wall biosynthesis
MVESGNHMTIREQFAVRASAVGLQLWRAGAPIYNLAIREGVRRLFRPARAERYVTGRDVRVVGLLSTGTGVGQSARLCIGELQRSGYRVSTCNLSKVFGVDDDIEYRSGAAGGEQTGGLTIYHLNPPLMLLGMLASGPRRYYRGSNIAYWAWELPELPPEWIVALDYVDAIMTPSTFCQETIQKYTTKPVLLVPHPVPMALGREAVRSVVRSGSSFRVLSIFNCGSSLQRKNPFAAIDAFKLAFGDDSGAELILKISDGRQHKSEVADLMKHIGTSRNIRILDTMMTEVELDRLIRSADVYLSLHRSEGFGLSVAEAAMRGVPIVVTGWSGTQDFCPADLAYVVDHQLVDLDDPHPAYCHVRHSHWAEPSISVAARRLLEVRRDPARALERAAALRERLIAHIDAHHYAKAIDAFARSSRQFVDGARTSAQQSPV